MCLSSRIPSLIILLNFLIILLNLNFPLLLSMVMQDSLYAARITVLSFFIIGLSNFIVLSFSEEMLLLIIFVKDLKNLWKVSFKETSNYLSNLTATYPISTATFLLTYLFLSTKLWCKPYYSDDKFNDSDDKSKTRMLYLSFIVR